MIKVAACAFAANLTCLYLLHKQKSSEAHFKASMIFTSNDVIVNPGVIAAGILVSLLHSNMPDLVIAIIVFIRVMRGAYRILKLAE
jgi:Co/Zn/Cd efflux system component